MGPDASTSHPRLPGALRAFVLRNKMNPMAVVTPEDCPPSGGEGVYDQGKLTAILTNILSNAVKFTEEGTIQAMAASDKSGAEIVVVDTGVGIETKDLDRVFDEFQQFDQPRKHKPSGFGLGLAIVATMVDSMGATLTVSSRKGVGTAFTLNVPSLDT